MSEKTPANIVDQAEVVIQGLETDRFGNVCLKTSKIRKFLSSVNIIRNEVLALKGAKKDMVLTEDMALEVKMLKANILYQAGRDKFVQEFIDKSHIIEKIDAVGTDYKKFDLLCKYIEALVAFHKYYGGAD